MGSAKLAPGSLLSAEDQERLYAEQMGAERTAAQVEARRRELGQCVCQPSKVRKRWSGADHPTVRTVHAATCPRHEPWMSG